MSLKHPPRAPLKLAHAVPRPARTPLPAAAWPLRAIALRCIKTQGPFVFGDRYYAIAGHKPTINQTVFDVMLEPGVCRSVADDIFVPENPANWPLFSHSQQLRHGPAASHRSAA